MRSNVWRDMSWSANAFLTLVWPAIASRVGDGEIQPVEISPDADMAHLLDVFAGIDAWQVQTIEGRIRGIASRIQAVRRPWDTFTIRYERGNGATTEFTKRLAAIEDHQRGWLFPHLTVHAYVDLAKEALLSAGIVETASLYRSANEHWRPDATFREQKRSGVVLRRNETEAGRPVSFLAVSYWRLREDGVRFVCVNPQAVATKTHVRHEPETPAAISGIPARPVNGQQLCFCFSDGGASILPPE